MYSKLIDGLKCGVVTNRYTQFLWKNIRYLYECTKIRKGISKNKERNKKFYARCVITKFSCF